MAILIRRTKKRKKKKNFVRVFDIFLKKKRSYAGQIIGEHGMFTMKKKLKLTNEYWVKF